MMLKYVCFLFFSLPYFFFKESTGNILPGRLTVGQWTLNPLIFVRIEAGQQTKMKNIIQPDEQKYIFTEGIEYKGLTVSIWGRGDHDTIDLLNKISMSGRWLNLAAGDGRYNNLLLEKVDELVASDIDGNALDKLIRTTPDHLRSKLKTKEFNMIGKFPFPDSYFEGVFTTGVLHLFPKQIIETVVSEIDRVLKVKGQIFIDFATDIKRVYPDGKQKVKTNEVSYTLKEAKIYLSSLFPNYSLKVIESSVPEETVSIEQEKYVFSCKFIVLIGTKKNRK